MFDKDEWTKEEYLRFSKKLEKKGVQTYLIDTILRSIKGVNTIVYNPYELQKLPKGSVFVFYCDTGKATKERLAFYRSKLPDYHCVSLKGGRGYFRPNLRLDDNDL